MSDTFKFVQAQEFSLAGGGAAIAATSIILNSFKQIDGTNLTMTDFGTIGYGTISPDTSRELQISFTGVTQNANGTATLTGVKTVLNVDPYTETSGLASSQAGNAVFVITNTAGFYGKFAVKGNDESVTGLWDFSQFPKKTGSLTPTSGAELATKNYVDSVAGGLAITDQVIETGVAGETLVAGNVVYFKTSDQRWWLADADLVGTFDQVKLAVAQGSATAGNPVNVLFYGLDKTQTGLTPGSLYYLSNTAGSISTTPGTTSVFLGWAQTANQFIFDPLSINQPTANEKAALASTSGTPSGSNKYVTENDTSNASTITGTTISFTASTKTIADSGNGFVTAGFRAGSSIIVTGSASNNGTYTVVSVSAGAIVVSETLVNESAGGSDTITTVTANKVVRRKSDSNITVPATPTASTDAGSKGYIDTSITNAAGGIGTNYPNTLFGNSTYFTKEVIIPASNILGWTVVSTTGRGGIGVSISFGGSITSNTLYTLTANTKNITVDFIATLNQQQTTNVGGFGIFDVVRSNDTTTQRIAITNNATDGFEFTTCNGSARTSTTITGVTLSAMNKYTIVKNGVTSVLLYVDGVLKATHTTNIPTSTALVIKGTSVTTSIELLNPIISIEI